MTGQQLKNSILQMAVQGKLVPQDPNDEPASVLLERIRSEKEALIKAGKIKKEKNPSVIFRGADNLPYEKVGKNESVCIADEVPFDIPDSWEWVRWGTLSESIQYGYNAPAQEHGRIKMVRISDIQDNSVLWETVPYCEINESEIDTYLLKPNDILFARTGGTVGKSYLVQDVPKEAIYAGYLIRTRYSNQLCPQYLKYFMESELYWSQLREGTIATAQPNCNGKTLGNMLVPIPPLSEQLRIVEKLNVTMAYVTEYSVVYSKAESLNNAFPDALKKSILQEAVQGKLVPQDENDEPASVLLERIRAEKQTLIKAGKIKKDKNESVIFRRDNSHYEKRGAEVVCIDDEIPFEIPDSWEWVRFDSATIYTTDYVANGSFASLRENVKSYKTPNYAIMVKTQDFANNFTRDLTYTDEAGFNFLKKSELFGGELMLSNIGASIGKVFIIPKMDKPMTLAPNSIVVKCIDNVTTRYLQYLMLSFYGQEMLKGFTAGTAMPKFSKTQLRNSLIPLPPHKLQERIVAKLDELFLKVDAL